jgi:cytochrome b
LVTDEDVKVWDPAVRIFHWSLVVAFLVAYFSAEELHDLHEFTGYLVLVLVIFRLVWGIVGNEYARFADFVRGPREVARNLRDIALMRPKRYLGHSPVGGAMVVVLLAMLAATSVTGIVVQEQGELMSLAAVASGLEDDDDDEHEAEQGTVAQLHETLSDLTIMLTLLHIAGVILASFTHRENLTKSMFTGRKRP